MQSGVEAAAGAKDSVVPEMSPQADLGHSAFLVCSLQSGVMMWLHHTWAKFVFLGKVHKCSIASQVWACPC